MSTYQRELSQRMEEEYYAALRARMSRAERAIFGPLPKTAARPKPAPRSAGKVGSGVAQVARRCYQPEVGVPNPPPQPD